MCAVRCSCGGDRDTVRREGWPRRHRHGIMDARVVGIGRGRRAFTSAVVVAISIVKPPRHRTLSQWRRSRRISTLRLQGRQGSVAGGSVAGLGRRARMPLARTTKPSTQGPHDARARGSAPVHARPDSARARAPQRTGSATRSTTASACWPARCRDEGRGLHPSSTAHPIR